MSDILKQIVQDIKVDLKDEFDRNFERKAFFDEKWKPTKRANPIGSLMARKNNLRRSLRASSQGNKILFSSSVPYASIHNEGGEIKITPQMRKYFWYMYYKNMQGISFNVESKKAKTAKMAEKNSTAEYYKNMAMHKGDTIKMPKRQFIGYHRSQDKVIEKIVNDNMTETIQTLMDYKFSLLK